MENPKIRKISSSGQKQGENMKIVNFSRESGRLASYGYRGILIYYRTERVDKEWT